MCSRVLMMPKAGDKMENFTILFKYSLRLPLRATLRRSARVNVILPLGFPFL